MTDEEYAVLEQVWKVYMDRKPVGCTRCRYCMPCPQGLDIPMLLGILNEWRMFSNKEKTKFYLSMFSAGKNPHACTACGVCMEKCPQSLKIPELMGELVALWEELGLTPPEE